jgi:glycosyltransferase involved in cell wall biosynthesis
VQFFEQIGDEGLHQLKSNAHAVLLPITYGGGSNLKTAEALAAGKWVVATSTSLRGYEEFREEPGVLIADDRQSFRKAVMQVYRRAPLELSKEAIAKRESVHWDRRFDRFHCMLRELNLV